MNSNSVYHNLLLKCLLCCALLQKVLKFLLLFTNGRQKFDPQMVESEAKRPRIATINPFAVCF